MKILIKAAVVLCAFWGCVFFGCFDVAGQSVTINQDEKFEQFLIVKRKLNSTITASTKYRVQLFIGNLEDSKKVLLSFKKENKMMDATIVFYTPNYKVLVGNFDTRIDAERNYNLLLKKYPKAILLKPAN